MRSESSVGLCDETAPDRRPLLCLSLFLRDPKSLKLQRRTDKRNLWIHENLAPHAQTSPAATGRRFLGRGNAGAPGETATRLQRNAQRDAAAHGPAARVHSKNSDAPTRFQKHCS